MITDVALGELEKGRTKGRQTADEVIALIHLGLVDVMRHRPEDDDLFLGLIAGKAVETLDDGEADTLVVANSCGCIAVIDERKATIIAARKFPHLNLRTTVDLLLSTEVIETLGLEIVCDSLHRALVSARMRIPEHHLAEVLRLIGPERAKACTSLPAAHRRGS
ncbi:putative nucleic acid-binding protein [Inquilinus ginsengisoli]|uniref:hypothetical protein n=1 Tax=Inquilinus ginsengisoli TaxID=363840 RepID=UPI003D253E62